MAGFITSCLTGTKEPTIHSVVREIVQIFHKNVLLNFQHRDDRKMLQVLLRLSFDQLSEFSHWSFNHGDVVFSPNFYKTVSFSRT